GVAIIILGPGLVSIGNSQFSNEVVLYNIFWGRFDPVVSWILLAVLVAVAGTGFWLRDACKRRQGLETPPRSLTAMKIVLMGGAPCGRGRESRAVPAETSTGLAGGGPGEFLTLSGRCLWCPPGRQSCCSDPGWAVMCTPSAPTPRRGGEPGSACPPYEPGASS